MKKVKVMALLIITSVLLNNMDIVNAGAGRETSTAVAGGVSITSEVGYNNTYSYATVTTSDLVDIKINMYTYYYNDNDEYMVHNSLQTRDYTSYCEASYTAPYDVERVSCWFEVYGPDEDWSKYSVVQEGGNN